jgi:hypothetical protein
MLKIEGFISFHFGGRLPFLTPRVRGAVASDTHFPALAFAVSLHFYPICKMLILWNEIFLLFLSLILMISLSHRPAVNDGSNLLKPHPWG